jgi:AraC family transcriptional regulator of adaptative response / DNA-3-methyladenine glycosylase II
MQYIAMRALEDPDAFPANDSSLLGSAFLPGERELIQRAQSWRPWRAYAAMYLWQADGQPEDMSTDLGTTRFPMQMQNPSKFSIETGT